MHQFASRSIWVYIKMSNIITLVLSRESPGGRSRRDRRCPRRRCCRQPGKTFGAGRVGCAAFLPSASVPGPSRTVWNVAARSSSAAFADRPRGLPIRMRGTNPCACFTGGGGTMRRVEGGASGGRCRRAGWAVFTEDSRISNEPKMRISGFLRVLPFQPNRGDKMLKAMDSVRKIAQVFFLRIFYYKFECIS